MAIKDTPSDRPAAATARLRLVGLDRELARMQVEDLPGFFRVLNVNPEAAWPPELHDDATMRHTLDRLEARPDETGWHGWVFIMRWADDAPGRLVGAGGFYGPPRGDGTVEIGYSMLPSFREQGMATEAVKGLAGWAFGQEGVRTIRARTLADGRASRRVLEKAGFALQGEETDPQEGRTALYALERPR